MKRLPLLLLLLVAGVACDKPTEDNCRKALANMQRLMGTENLRDPAALEGEVRRCKGGSKKKAVDCAINATTLDELSRCDFYKLPTTTPAGSAAPGSAAPTTPTGSAATGAATGGGSMGEQGTIPPPPGAPGGIPAGAPGGVPAGGTVPSNNTGSAAPTTQSPAGGTTGGSATTGGTATTGGSATTGGAATTGGPATGGGPGATTAGANVTPAGAQVGGAGAQVGSAGAQVGSAGAQVGSAGANIR